MQVHLRHLVGGRARSFLGQIPHERMFQVRPGPVAGCTCCWQPTLSLLLIESIADGAQQLHGIPTAPVPCRLCFPELPGALRTFLSILSPRWNITLFHYRKTGE